MLVTYDERNNDIEEIGSHKIFNCSKNLGGPKSNTPIKLKYLNAIQSQQLCHKHYSSLCEL